MAVVRHPGHPSSTLVDAPARVQAIGRRAQGLVELAVLRAVGHVGDPRRFPLPEETNSLERALVSRVHRLSPDARRGLEAELDHVESLSATGRGRRYPGLAAVDLHAPRSLAQQVRELPLPRSQRLTKADRIQLAEYARKRFPHLGSPPPVPDAPANASGMSLRVTRARCVKATLAEAGADEMVLGAIVIDHLGSARETGVVDLGSYRKGDVRNLDVVVARFEDFLAGDFPKLFVAAPILTERDRFDEDNNFSTFEWLLTGLAELVAAALAVALVPVLGEFAVLVALVSMAIGLALVGLALMLEDDVFPSGPAYGVFVESPLLVQPAGAVETLTFKRLRAEYEITMAFVVEP